MIEKRNSFVLFFFRSLRALLLLGTTVLLLPFAALAIFLIVLAAYADEALENVG
jgi:hypothetical protein